MNKEPLWGYCLPPPILLLPRETESLSETQTEELFYLTQICFEGPDLALTTLLMYLTTRRQYLIGKRPMILLSCRTHCYLSESIMPWKYNIPSSRIRSYRGRFRCPPADFKAYRPFCKHQRFRFHMRRITIAIATYQTFSCKDLRGHECERAVTLLCREVTVFLVPTSLLWV